MLKRYVSFLFVLCSALHMVASSAVAQVMDVTCVQPANAHCTDSIQPPGDLQFRHISVRVTRRGLPVVGALVRLKATNGTLTPDSIHADAQGLINSQWARNDGADQVAISVAAIDGRGSAVTVVTLIPKAPKSKPKLVLENSWKRDKSWFEKNQIPRTVKVAVKQLVGDKAVHINQRQVCEDQKVAFIGNARAGSVSPDTAIAELRLLDEDRKEKNSVQNAKRLALLTNDSIARGAAGCFVSAHWTLGEGPGDRQIRAKIVPGKGFDAPYSLGINSTARALPRFIAGFATSPNKEYLGLKKGAEKKIRVERLLSDGSKEIFDTTITATNSVDSVDSERTVNVIAGVSIALPLWRLQWFDRLSATGGVDLGSPREDFYLGLSLGRLVGPSVEALPLDLHGLLHFGKDDVLEDPNACSSSGECKTRSKMRRHGWALMLSADATSLITEVIKRLVP